MFALVLGFMLAAMLGVIVMAMHFPVLSAGSGCFCVGLPPGKGLSRGGEVDVGLFAGREVFGWRWAEFDSVGKVYLNTDRIDFFSGEIFYSSSER